MDAEIVIGIAYGMTIMWLLVVALYLKEKRRSRQTVLLTDDQKWLIRKLYEVTKDWTDDELGSVAGSLFINSVARNMPRHAVGFQSHTLMLNTWHAREHGHAVNAKLVGKLRGTLREAVRRIEVSD